MMKETQINLLEEWERTSTRALLDLLETIDVSNDAAFAKVIEMATERLGISSAAIAGEFDINRSTVARWATGRTKPHKMVRPLIVDWLRTRLENRLHALVEQSDERGSPSEVMLQQASFA